MPPPNAQPKLHPKHGFLTKKVGPLPTWAWGGIVVALVGAYWLMRRSGSGGGTAPPPQLVTGASTDLPAPQDYPMGGYPAGATPVGQMISPDVAANLNPSADGSPDMSSFSSALTDLYTYEQQRDTDLSSQLAGLNSGIAALTASMALSAPTTAAPTATSPVTKNQGVEWGGRNFTTKKSLSSWLSARGSSYDVWAQKHPEATKHLSGSVPVVHRTVKPAPPRRTAPKTPKNRTKPAPKPKPQPHVAAYGNARRFVR